MLTRYGVLVFSLTFLSRTSSPAQLQESTTIGGYGNAFYQRDANQKKSTADVERFVLFLGHSFNAKTSFVSELEIEDAKVSGGETGGEVALEQAYLKFNIDPDHYFTAGLFIPRIGILNENHLPNTFNGNARTQVETFILPSTWRELGIGFYGSINSGPFNYSAAIVNGLNSEAFEHGSGIRQGRFEGRNASANNLAITGALQFNIGNIKTQVSGYYGGSVAAEPQQADTLGLASGMFGTPVIVGEADVQFESGAFSAKILGTIVSIPDAANINRAYANNAPQTEYGAYAEVAYNLFQNIEEAKPQQLNLFVRYEKLDMNASIPYNGTIDATLNQGHLTTGLSYLPLNNVVLKADVRFVRTGNQNPAISSGPYETSNTFITLGFGFSF